MKTDDVINPDDLNSDYYGNSEDSHFDDDEEEIAGYVCLDCGHDQDHKGGAYNECEKCGSSNLEEIYF